MEEKNYAPGHVKFMKKLDRVRAIQDLIASGVTTISGIARHFDIKWETAKSEIQLGNIIFKNELSPANIARQRRKVNAKLVQIASEARQHCADCIEKGLYREAISFFKQYVNIYGKYIPGIWGLDGSAADRTNTGNITVDTMNLNKIDMTLSKLESRRISESIHKRVEEEFGIRT